ncbi:MAG: hypothetical protein AB1749_05465 [Pseudomonadota bacterium]
MPRNLVDTGALIAFIDANDPWHAAVVKAFARASLPLLATQAVLTETFHLARRIDGTDALWTLLLAGPVAVAQIAETELPALRKLMTRYADRPMDYADATLVHVAARERISTILTIDNDDFETYRIGSTNRRFRVLPGRGG